MTRRFSIFAVCCLLIAAVAAAQRHPGAATSRSRDEQLREAVASCTSDAPAALDACRRAVRLGLAESGMAIPETEVFYERIARAFVADSRLPEALSMYRAAVRRFPLNAGLHYELGKLLVDRFDASEEALGPFMEAVRRRPQFTAAMLALADVQSDLQRYDDAIPQYRGVLIVAPEQPAALVGLGRALAATGDQTGAIAALEKATRAAPASDRAWTALGQSLLAAGRAEEASAVLDKAVAINPNAFDALCLLSQALSSRGKLEEARAACSKARRPTSHGVYPCVCDR